MHRKYELIPAYLQTFLYLKQTLQGWDTVKKTQLTTLSFMVRASQRELYFASLHSANFRKFKPPKNSFLNFQIKHFHTHTYVRIYKEL